ncbi:MAG: Ig-like domain repeat protein, partial [Actinomycetota bacterium]|nr:Ig-like domain repeat protein [Actinomycetota bacterium]
GITALSAGGFHTLGLNSDGTVVATGNNGDGQCNVGTFSAFLGTIGGTGNAVGLRAVADSGFAGWDCLTSDTSTLVAGQAVKFGVRLSGDGVSWTEVLGADGQPIDWTTGSGNYLGRAFGAAERTDLSALPRSRYIDTVVRMESNGGPELELMGVSVTYDRDDLVAPTVSDNAPSGWQTSDVTVAITATDTVSGVAGLDVAVSGPGMPVTTVTTETATVAVSAEGTTTIEYSAIDEAGNRCATQTASVRLDKTAPDLSIIASPSEVSLVASDSDSGLTGVWYRVDGGAPQLYTGVPFSPGPSGKHTVTAWTRDVAGNVAATSSEVTVDTEAPVASVSAPSGWRTADTTVTLNAYDAHSSIASIDWVLSGATTGSGTSAASPAAVPVTAEGTTTIEYSALDTAGNRCATETATVRIDKTAPGSSATHTAGWTTGPVSVTLGSSDPVSGVDSIWYRTSPVGAWIRYEGAFQVSTTGTTTVAYWAADIAGNTEAPRSTTVLVDDAVPTVSDNAPSGWRKTDVAFALSAIDPDSGVAAFTYRRTDPGGGTTDVTLAAATAPLSVTIDGTTTVEYSATDAVGNRCATETVVVRLDKTAPSTTATYTPGSASTPAVVTLAPSDAHSGVASTWYRLGSSAATLYEGAFPLSTSGETIVTFWSVDAVGNAEAPDTMAVWLDSAAPIVLDDAPAGWVTANATVTL